MMPIVTTGVVRVGTLSLSGSTRAGGYGISERRVPSVPSAHAGGSRPRRTEIHAEFRSADHQRGADVVAVAEVGHRHTLEPAKPLSNRHHVCERLTRVRAVG